MSILSARCLNKVALLSLIIHCVLSFVDAVATEGDARRLPLSAALGLYSSIASFMVLVGNKSDVLAALRHAHHVAQNLHQNQQSCVVRL